MVKSPKNRGFIGTIILIIIGLAALKYFFGWSIFDAMESERGRETVAYIRDVLDTVWSYIGTPVVFIWREVVLPLFELAWDSLQELLARGRA